MPTAKARFAGSSEGGLVDFSAELRASLHALYSRLGFGDVGDERDAFIARVLHEASWAAAQMRRRRLDTTKQEMRAEQQSLSKSLRQASKKLRTLSPDFDRLLGIAADPLGLAGQIDAFAERVEGVKRHIDCLPKAAKLSEKRNFIAVEMAIHVLRVLKEHGVAAAATADPDRGRYSHAIRILKLIGDDIGLRLSEATWRGKVIAAKRAAPDLLSP